MVRKLVSVLIALTLGTSVGTAQEKATELTVSVVGLSAVTCSGSCDGAFIFSTGDAEHGYFSAVGGGSIGVGFYLSPSLAIEPTVSFSTISSGGEGYTVLGIGAAVPYYVAKGWGRKGAYFAPRFTYNSISGNGSSDSQWSAGAALGTKVPLNAMAALRLQAGVDHAFEGDLGATTAFSALLGLSVFLKK